MASEMKVTKSIYTHMNTFARLLMGKLGKQDGMSQAITEAMEADWGCTFVSTTTMAIGLSTAT